MTRWEYLTAEWSAKAMSPLKWTYVFHITYPSGEKRKFDLNDAGYLSLLNQLGQEGWELVTHHAESTAMFRGEESFGVDNVATPVSAGMIFKRPINEEDPD